MFSSNKNIDIIMPNFNKEKYIGKAIQSVLKQSYKNWKLFIIDDNSSDNSREVILNYKKDKRIKFFSKKK